MALKEVTRDELQAVIAQLKEALYNHQQWYGGLIRTLVCKLPGNKHDLSPRLVDGRVKVVLRTALTASRCREHQISK